MRYYRLACFLGLGTGLLFTSAAYSQPTAAQKPIQPVPIIFDTDISGDYDDAGALAMLHALENSGEIKILATVASNLSPLVVPTIEVFNTYYGNPDIPIGTLKGEGATQDSRELHWPDTLMLRYPHRYRTNDDAPNAVDVYRRVLAQQPDSSVTLVTVGFLTNLRNLLQSEPDALSPLAGKQLVARKVRRWVAMAGGFPRGKETNVVRDSAAAKYAIDEWPTPIVFSGFEIGVKVLTGLELIKTGVPESPAKRAYAISIPKRPRDKNGRPSWDQTAVLVAARGVAPYYTVKRGWFVTASDGTNTWRDDPNGRHAYLVESMDPQRVAHEIESLMLYQPGSKKQ